MRLLPSAGSYDADDLQYGLRIPAVPHGIGWKTDMNVFPAPGTRTSFPLNNVRLLRQLNADQSTIQSYYDQLSTGRRVQGIGEDPIATNRAIRLQNSIRYGEQLVRNADEASSFYGAADQTLARIDNALISANATAVEAAQGTLSTEERESLAVGVRQLLSQVMAAGNTTFREHQVVAGILQSGPSLQQQGETVLFRGSEATGQTRFASGTGAQTTVAMQEALGSRQPMISGAPFGATVQRDTRLVDLRAGQGVAAGPIRLSDGSGFREVDLSAAATVGDLKDLLEAVDFDGRRLSVQIDHDGFQVAYEDGLPGTLAVDDVPGFTTAADLNLLNPDGSQPPPLTAGDLDPRVTLATPLQNLAGGAGIDPSAGLQIRQGEKSFVVELHNAETVGDVVTAINRSDADVRAGLGDSGGIEIHALRMGVDYSVGENGGTVAEELGLRTGTRDVALQALAGGQGIALDAANPDLSILRPDGRQLDLELEGLRTIGDVVDAINQHPDNQDPLRVSATLATTGNGLQLTAPSGAGPITVSQPSASNAGHRLGLIPGSATSATSTSDGASEVLVGDDFFMQRPGGPIDALLRLEVAVRDGDIREVGILQAEIDASLDQAVKLRGRVGAWQQNAEILRENAANQVVSLQEAKSNAIDADFAQVISDMTQRQSALEATMRLISQTAQLSVLNFL